MEYKKYQNMVNRWAWNISRKYKLEFEDCLAQANCEYAVAVARFDPDKASFSTFLFNHLRGYMNAWAKKEKNQQMNYFGEYLSKINAQDVSHSLLEDEKIEYINQPNYISDNGKWMEQVLGLIDLEMSTISLSEDAFQILLYVMEFVYIGYDKKPRLYITKTHFKNNRGWKHSRTENAWNELKDWYQELVA